MSLNGVSITVVYIFVHSSVCVNIISVTAFSSGHFHICNRESQSPITAAPPLCSVSTLPHVSLHTYKHTHILHLWWADTESRFIKGRHGRGNVECVGGWFQQRTPVVVHKNTTAHPEKNNNKMSHSLKCITLRQQTCLFQTTKATTARRLISSHPFLKRAQPLKSSMPLHMPLSISSTKRVFHYHKEDGTSFYSLLPDLKYRSGGSVWLLGACMCHSTTATHQSRVDEHRLLLCELASHQVEESLQLTLYLTISSLPASYSQFLSFCSSVLPFFAKLRKSS